MDTHVVFVLMEFKGNNWIFPLAELIIVLRVTMTMRELLMEQPTNQSYFTDDNQNHTISILNNKSNC